MLKITRNKINGNSWYNYYFKENDNVFGIIFMTNGDLYFKVNRVNKNRIYEFSITKENINIYNLFDKLFNNIKNPEIFKVDDFQLERCDSDEDRNNLYKQYEEWNNELKERDIYKSLFDNDKVTWICDDCENFDIDKSNSFQIIKEDDKYKLMFRFNDKNPYIRSIRVCNCGSRYNPFNMIIKDFFHELQEYNPIYYNNEECISEKEEKNKNIFKIKEFKYEDKLRTLSVISSGKVRSTKYFPVFKDEGKEKIFKPLSKTKPLSTPLFSYSEVYWSYLINKYIDNSTPVYNLAYCHGVSKEQPKYYEKGCIVENVLNEGEYFVNLLELFRMYPDNLVNIDEYINYCELQYDYTAILNSDFFRNNKELSEKLAEQILCSILRRDDNYHYENVSLIFKDEKVVRIAPIIDQEFSQMFMYPDKLESHESKFSYYDEGMMPIFSYDDEKSYEENLDIFKKRVTEGSIYDYFDRGKSHYIMRNIKTITELYPDMCKEFINKLSKMKKEFDYLNINVNQDFLGTFSTDDWEPYHMIFKENRKIDDKLYLNKKERVENSRIMLDEISFNNQLKREVLWSIDKLISTINFFLDFNKGIYLDITKYENKTLYEKVKRYNELIMEYFKSAMEEAEEEQNKEKKFTL